MGWRGALIVISTGLHRCGGHAHRRARPQRAAASYRATFQPTRRPRRASLRPGAGNARADKLLAREVWVLGRRGAAHLLGGASRGCSVCAPSARRRDAWAGCGSSSMPAFRPARSWPGAHRRGAGLRRQDHRARLHRHRAARRQDRPDRPQWRQQDHAAAPDPGELEPDAGRVRQGTPAAGGLLRPDARGAGPGTPRWPTPSARAASGLRWAAACNVMSYLGDFLFAPSAPIRCTCTLWAASATGCCWHGCSRCRPTCWCSTNRPTTWTSTPSKLLEELYEPCRARCSWSADRRFLGQRGDPRIAWEGELRPDLWREYEGGSSTTGGAQRALAGGDGMAGHAARAPRPVAAAAAPDGRPMQGRPRGRQTDRRGGSTAAGPAPAPSSASRPSAAGRTAGAHEALRPAEGHRRAPGQRRAVHHRTAGVARPAGTLRADRGRTDGLDAGAGRRSARDTSRSAGRRSGARSAVAAEPAFVGGRRVGAADDQPGLQVQRVGQPPAWGPARSRPGIRRRSRAQVAGLAPQLSTQAASGLGSGSFPETSGPGTTRRTAR